MEQGVLHPRLQPGQVGAAPDEVPLCPEAGKPVPQVIAGIPPDRRVAVQSERLAEDLNGHRLNVHQRRHRPTAAQTGPRESVARRLQLRSTARPHAGRGPWTVLPKPLEPWKKSLTSDLARKAL